MKADIAPTGGLAHLGPLDGLRALAILIVMISHAGIEAIPGGFGVTIFFFLSGYLITTLLRIELAKNGQIDFYEFYRRRAYRIIPPFLVTIVVCCAIASARMFPEPPTQSGLLTDLTFLTNYAPQLGAGRGLPIPLWSLDVEEHFYLIFPIFLFVAFKKEWSAPRVVLSLCLLILAVRLWNVFALGIIDQNYYWSHTRLDSILFGCLLALWQNPAVDRAAWKPTIWHFGAAIATLLLCLAFRSPLFRETIRYTLQGSALLVVFSYVLSHRGFLATILSSGAARVIAAWSYTLYLIHMPVFAVLKNEAPTLHPAIAALAAFGVSAAYAAAMRTCIEKPLLNRRKRFAKGAVSHGSGGTRRTESEGNLQEVSGRLNQVPLISDQPSH